MGLERSRAVREALKALAVGHGRPAPTKVIGVGRFASGISDLGSNPEHLIGFGR